MKKIFKKFLGATLSVATIISSFAPMTVLADGTYDIILTFDDGYTATAEGNRINVYRPNETDAHITEARNVDTNTAVGTANCTDDTHCTITIDDSITTKLNTSEPVFSGDNQFDLDTPINVNTSLSFRVVNQQQQNNVTVHLDGVSAINGNVLTFNVDNTNINVTISSNMGAQYTINGMDVSIPETDTYNVKFQLPSNFDKQKYEIYALVGDNTSVITTSGDNDFSVGGYTGDLHLGIRQINNNQNNNENNNQNQPNDPNAGPNGPQFDGKAYILWSCKSGGICMKHFDNIPNFDDGNSTFYKDTTIVDDRTGETFDVNAKYRGWSTDDRFNDWVAAYKSFNNITGDIDWSKVDPYDMIGDPVDMRQFEDGAVLAGICTKENTPEDVFKGCVDNYAVSLGKWVSRAQLQPVGEPQVQNAYVSYGDRNFKVVIYNSNYKGITIGDLSDLSYYPASWTNPYIRRDQYDISGTTKENPTGVDAILLEKTINIKALNVNEFEIVKLEALDVPSDAVTISKVNGEWKLVFSSHFYDNVVFKATDNKGEVTYFTVKRSTVDAWINNVEGAPHYYAEVYYDKNNTYKDFDLTAKITYKDGTTEKVKLTHYNKIDDGLGNITIADEIDETVSPDPNAPNAGGKGLKKAVFVYKLPKGKTDRDIKEAYTNIEYKGSTSTNYAGAYAGSGKGVLANIYQEEE